MPAPARHITTQVPVSEPLLVLERSVVRPSSTLLPYPTLFRSPEPEPEPRSSVQSPVSTVVVRPEAQAVPVTSGVIVVDAEPGVKKLMPSPAVSSVYGTAPD